MEEKIGNEPKTLPEKILYIKKIPKNHGTEGKTDNEPKTLPEVNPIHYLLTLYEKILRGSKL